MNVNSVDIYEFSTGIKFDRLNNGGWVSRGFSGEYMNCTIDPVPLAVERSISNREFRIAEGTASEDPAVVGRVVGEGVDSWSVVAIISRGEDEVGRGVSFYRYFLAEGTDKIPYILEWLEQDKQTRNSSQIRIFNPLDIVNSNQPYISTVKPPTLNVAEKQLNRLDEEIPVILDNKIPSPIFIHTLTIKKVELEKLKGNNVPVAWAFNVEAVEQVRRFTVIRSASDNALDLLNRAKASADKALPLGLFDEQSLKSACKAITNSSSSAIKSEYVRTFTEAIGNQVIGSTHWEKIFDGQGANNALKQKIYTPQMIKLLVIRALAIPSTLPQYLGWRAGAGKNNNVDTIAQEFEQKLKGKLKEINNQSQDLPPSILRNIVEGFGTVLSKFLNDDSVSLEAIASLLKDYQGLWGSQSKQFIASLDRDLNKMHGFANPQQQNYQRSQNSMHGNMMITRHYHDNPQSSALVPNSAQVQFELNDESWQKIWKDIAPFWRKSRHHTNEKYTKFAELFEKLEINKIALIFYHISQGILSPQKFRLLTNSKSFSKEVYGVTVRREKSFIEEVLDSIGSIFYYLREDPLENNPEQQTMRRILTIGIVSLSFISGIAFGNTSFGRLPFFNKDNSSQKNIANDPQETPNEGSSRERRGEPKSSSLDSEQRSRLATNINSIYELKKDLESQKNQSYQNNSELIYVNIEEEILEKFGFNRNDNFKLTEILQAIDNQNIKSKDRRIYIEKTLKDWRSDEILTAIKPMDIKTSNKPLQDAKKSEVLKGIRKDILNVWATKVKPINDIPHN